MTWVTITERYEPVRRTGYKRVRCTGCGKLLRRQRTFQQTLSPFNKHPNGQLKTREDIIDQLKERIERWEQEPERCHVGCAE